MSHKCNAPLFVELNVANLTYMRSACVWQIEHMGFKRGRAPKKNKNLDDGSDESKNEVESVESKESDEDMMCECDDNVSKEGDDEAMASVVDDPVELDSHGAFATHTHGFAWHCKMCVSIIFMCAATHPSHQSAIRIGICVRHAAPRKQENHRNCEARCCFFSLKPFAKSNLRMCDTRLPNCIW